MELAINKHDSSIIPLPIRAIIQARTDISISELDSETALNRLSNLVGAVNTRLSYKINKEDLAITVFDFYNILSRRFKAITMTEINIAFEKGSLGEYGQFMGVGSATLFNWIKTYMTTDTDRKRALQAIKSREINTNNSLSDSDISEMMLKYIIDKYLSKFKDYGGSSGAYDYMDSKGLINISVERKNELLVIAKDNIINHRQIQTHRGLFRRSDTSEFIKSLLPTDKVVINEAKRLALVEVLKEYETVEDLKRALTA